MIPEDEKFIELGFRVQLKQGKSPSLHVYYKQFRNGNERSAYYCLNGNDGSIIQSKSEGEIYK